MLEASAALRSLSSIAQINLLHAQLAGTCEGMCCEDDIIRVAARLSMAKEMSV